jgi:hypothetical protein
MGWPHFYCLIFAKRKSAKEIPMNNEEFMAERENFHKELTEILNRKAQGYDTSKSRFEHFRRAALLNQESTAETVMSMASKHEVSLHDMVRAVSKGQTFERKVWLEKIGDMRNYCDLLWGVLMEDGDI